MAKIQARVGAEQRDDGLKEKMIAVNRVTKVVKGGRILGFAALTVVGDGDGKIGMGKGKSREVPVAVTKAMDEARRKMVRVALRNGTLQHPVHGQHGAARVYIAPAAAGTGIIAGGPMRAIFESLGVADVVTKSVGTSNPYNMIRATFEALGEQVSPKAVAQRRGKKVADLLRRGGASAEVAQADAEAIAE
jgi:small subunit ribosomal protein S5